MFTVTRTMDEIDATGPAWAWLTGIRAEVGTVTPNVKIDSRRDRDFRAESLFVDDKLRAFFVVHRDVSNFTVLVRCDLAAPFKPLDVVIHCPRCGLQHVDAPEAHTPECDAAVAMHDDDVVTGAPSDCICGAWTNPPHKSHKCHGCDHIWRTADIPTNGVLKAHTTGEHDSPVVGTKYNLAITLMVTAQTLGAYALNMAYGQPLADFERTHVVDLAGSVRVKVLPKNVEYLITRKVADEVIIERRKQIEFYGHTPEKDLDNPERLRDEVLERVSGQPTPQARQQLVEAAAIIFAEIERIDRLAVLPANSTGDVAS